MRPIKVSVILPNYNYARYLNQRIDSILNQTFPDFELIILDDSSYDNSKEIIESYKKLDNRIRTIYNNENSGNPFIQWKKGIELAKGNYIWIAEADDYCENTLLAKLLDPFKSNSNIGISYCQSNKIDTNGQITELWTEHFDLQIKNKFKKDFVYTGLEFIEKYLIYQNVIPNASAVLLAKSVYKSVDGVNVEINNCADWLLWLKMLNNSHVAFIAEPLNYFRRHENSIIHKSPQQLIADNKFHEFYSLTMRLCYDKWLISIKKNKGIKNINNHYISLDFANKMKWAKKHETKLKAFNYFWNSLLRSKSKFSVLKRFIFN